MVSVSDEADISRHHKSGGWVRSGEVSHTGSPKVNFLWPLKPPPGKQKPLNVAAGKERQPPLALHVNPRPLTIHMLLQMGSFAELWQRSPHAARYAKLDAAILSTLWKHHYTTFLIIWHLCTNGELQEENWFAAVPCALFNSICRNQSLAHSLTFMTGGIVPSSTVSTFKKQLRHSCICY